MLTAIITLTLATLFGLAFGSFLNVCIARLPRGESVVRPRSHCPRCAAVLLNRDNIPLLSFLLLRGRCRNCGARISPQYPLVEAATALWFAGSFAPFALLLPSDTATSDPLFATAVHSGATAILGFLLIGLAIMDWQTGLLPNDFTVGGLAAGIFFAFAESFFVPANPVRTLFTPEEVFIAQHLAAALLGFTLLWVIGALYRAVRHKPGIGGGDPKLLAMIGSFLGLGPLCVTFLVGTALATAAATVLLARRQASAGTPLRYGSFLALAGLIAAFWGERLVAWYLGLFR